MTWRRFLARKGQADAEQLLLAPWRPLPPEEVVVRRGNRGRSPRPPGRRGSDCLADRTGNEYSLLWLGVCMEINLHVHTYIDR